MADLILLPRAWVVAHRGVPALVAGVAVATGAAVYGASSISLWGTVRQIPLWALVPGTLVMIAGTVWDGHFDGWPAVQERRVRRARLLWLVVVLAVVTLLAVPTAIALSNAVVTKTATVLTVAAFAPAMVDIRLAAATGAVANVAALTLIRQIDVNQSVAQFLDTLPTWIWIGLLAAGMVGAADYVRGGARRLGRRALPG